MRSTCVQVGGLTTMIRTAEFATRRIGLDQGAIRGALSARALRHEHSIRSDAENRTLVS